jgi:endonuclease I
MGILRTTVLLLVAPACLAGDYYQSVDAGTPETLRTTLHEVIDDHQRYPYTSGATDTWKILEEAEQDPNNPANIIDVYRNASYQKIGGGVGVYNREHTWPNSYGFPDDGASNYPFTDTHALMLSNSSYNSSRGNKPFGLCSPACTEYVTDLTNGTGGGSGQFPGNSNWANPTYWQVWHGKRGDVARGLLYLDVRYEGGTHGVTGHSEPDLILTDDPGLIQTTGGNNASVAYMGLLSVLIAWHEADPPDVFEQHRNDVIYSHQGNRNPFIDHPEWIACLHLGECGDSDLIFEHDFEL